MLLQVQALQQADISKPKSLQNRSLGAHFATDKETPGRNQTPDMAGPAYKTSKKTVQAQPENGRIDSACGIKAGQVERTCWAVICGWTRRYGALIEAKNSAWDAQITVGFVWRILNDFGKENRKK